MALGDSAIINLAYCEGNRMLSGHKPWDPKGGTMKTGRDVGIEAATIASLANATERDIKTKSKIAHAAQELINLRNDIRSYCDSLGKQIALARVDAAIQHLADASFNATAAAYAEEQVRRNT